MSYLPENDTPTLYNNVLWVADDGSYGTGRVLAVDTSKWTPAQWDKFNELTEGSDPDIEQVLAIAEMSDTTSDKRITMFLRKSELGDIIADLPCGIAPATVGQSGGRRLAGIRTVPATGLAATTASALAHRPKSVRVAG